MYVAVKGGEKAIRNSHALISEERRGDLEVPELTVEQIREQMSLSVDRVMTEGSIYDRNLAALAIKQAQGDLVEAIFLLRAFRATLPRLAHSLPLDTAKMQVQRRISASYKDLPGGQILGPTYDYTHRLLDFNLALDGMEREQAVVADQGVDPHLPRVADVLNHEGLIEPEQQGAAQEPFDLTRQPMSFPASRDQRLQALARGDEGFLLALGYSTQRGYGGNHPFAGEIRLGEVEVWIQPEGLDFAVSIGDIKVSECQMINQFKGNAEHPPQFTRGYGLAFGHSERKTMAMALVDRALRAPELGESVRFPAQQPEFVLYHSDNVEASGFVQHLKLPHYVDFQAELQLVRQLRQEHQAKQRDKQQAASQGADSAQAPSTASQSQEPNHV